MSGKESLHHQIKIMFSFIQLIQDSIQWVYESRFLRFEATRVGEETHKPLSYGDNVAKSTVSLYLFSLIKLRENFIFLQGTLS
jgi:hypothetical protein